MSNHTETLATYVSDMHALEKHLLEAFERQLDLTKDNAEAHRVVQTMVSRTRQHVTALEQQIERLTKKEPSKGILDTIKTLGSGLLGFAAGAIDAVRPQQDSKALRDSYTALNLAIISYVMLQTTAAAVNDQTVIDLAKSHLQNHMHCIQEIASVMPSLVVKDLSDDIPGLNASAISGSITGTQDLSAIFGTQSRTV